MTERKQTLPIRHTELVSVSEHYKFRNKFGMIINLISINNTKIHCNEKK